MACFLTRPEKRIILQGMEVSVAEAKAQLSKLLHAAEDGEAVVITRHGRPVARLVRPERTKGKVRLGAMRGQYQLQAGWNDPIDEDDFLAGRY
jgi:prevent-host-death family protein